MRFLVFFVVCCFVLLWAELAFAQDAYVQQGDEYQLVRESEYIAVVDYLNSETRMSPGNDVNLEHDGLSVTVHTVVNFGGRGAERITVTAPDGWVVDPPFLDVEDGQGGTLYLSRIVEGLM